MPGDFVCTSANDGTHLFRPITARAHTLWQEKGFINYVIDNTEDYYKNTIGVTVLDERNLSFIIFKVDRDNAPYVRTKPFHSSQEVVSTAKDGSTTFKMRVHQNFELERLFLGFGDALEVLAPKKLRRRIAYKLKKAAENYQ